MNPHPHTPFCQSNASIQACCIACKWIVDQQAGPTPKFVEPQSFEERITSDDIQALRGMHIKF